MKKYIKKNIHIKQWLELKPYRKHTKTDSYYLKISNKVHRLLIKNSHSLTLRQNLEKHEIEMLACFLTSFLEDKVSHTGIWDAFVDLHYEMYNKKLPFYGMEDYDAKAINPQDICFLMWYFLNSIGDRLMVSPVDEFIYEISQSVYDLFITIVIRAPKNQDLKACYHLDPNEKDYYVIRKLLRTVLLQTYLFYPDTVLDYGTGMHGIASKDKNDPNIKAYMNDFGDNTVHQVCTQLLSLDSRQWLAKIIGEKHSCYQDILSLSPKINGLFLYKGQDSENVFIQHIASGKKFDMTKLSFDEVEEFDTIDNIFHIGIVKWRNQWWFSGVSSIQPYSAEVVAEEKKSIASRMNVGFLDIESGQITDALVRHGQLFKEYNGGSSIAFLASDKIEEFNNGFIKYRCHSINPSHSDVSQTNQSLKSNELETDHQVNFAEASKSGLVFFNPKSGLEIVLKSNSAFPLPNNPYFNLEESIEHTMQIITDSSISPELVNYCIDHFRSDLPLFDSILGQFLLDDLDFFLRYWKKEKYHSASSVSIVLPNSQKSAMIEQ